MKFATLRKTLPPSLAESVSGYAFRQVHIGLSPSKVFRLEAANKNSLYLKTSPRVPGFSLLQEKLKLEWLEDRLPVPKVLQFAEDENTDYLLLSEISGRPASDDSLKKDTPRIVEQLATGLKTIHNLPVEDCPFDAQLDSAIKLARERMINGLVEPEDFDEERQDRTAEDLFQELIAAKPTDEDLTFTHGDYCVPNVILKNGKLSGFVDWGNAGVADKYQDIALLSRSVCYNFGEEWEKSVFKIYGIEPDWKKIHFYRLLDEFFNKCFLSRFMPPEADLPRLIFYDSNQPSNLTLLKFSRQAEANRLFRQTPLRQP
jgi:aminoglycoside phosphotransferase